MARQARRTPRLNGRATEQRDMMPRAPRRCPGNNYQCPNTITNNRYCPEHTKPWQGQTTGQGSTRATRAARDACLNRANHHCQLNHPGCTIHATEAHHTRGLADTGRHRADAIDLSHLTAACRWCHNIETQKQAKRARKRQ